MSDEDRIYIRCQSCARGVFGPEVSDMNEAGVIAVIIPCDELFERNDQKFQCPGPRVWKRR